ncbi:MAG: Tpl protein [Candidatus Falkowbacteria bacterium GW2011_GWC2_38_22]|uniref:Tpl protein n=1 Tax=Candidatus Falkowbacteria bacterium GW2011_GWE1_38_31 TaxID=1618638 RepID=A0A0G0JTC6_9BACT|nr:MAG: Tpl protein [Candidatus Falkowbacteria bacterium GW2011_GWF2_38_1205]KKQ61970.1 MAG: Tpl protein [Candidatus Falkowbacteria bacterium GW2011_GWC2_38_22]KKQ63868.1 MAG: Tpl protein [Candidatus Falkowbacteria bacterium GW2011_GWF1_38_22]KKQ66125.1 MAG: Tpl protein [Candidatus Falkowbacteria bacterium GW2011_GWE2_38_254]KKQ70728.1 MAG: Tpl protein [Candidatus Falkowbacteria bacterium GW2011_GWE1_38_31]KKQ73098.1 MAG: Tpl protein [Candidatus Falkowbacteria bacterium GW2011_GWD2_38_42]HAM8
MKIAQIKFVSWDKEYNFSLNGLDLAVGDKVIVKTELGMELGEIVGFIEIDPKKVRVEELAENAGEQSAQTEPMENAGQNVSETNEKVIKAIIRKASAHDLERMTAAKDKQAALDICQKVKDRFNLPMKFVDAHFSYDGSRITFAFIADGRVDFRELVKELTRSFNKSIRLQQIGIRDEAKIMGDIGHCGKGLCCRGHLRQLESINSEMAELQDCSHRGSDRISGICGRLMCCLAYEQKGYEELAKRLPPLGTKVNVDGKRGIVVGHHTLKESVDVEFREGGENGTKIVVEVDLNRKKKK